MANDSIPQVEETKIDGHIYVITNMVNGKQYIGQTTKTIEHRWKEHIIHAHYGEDSAIYRAIRKYGEASFAIIEIDQADSIEQLNAIEESYISVRFRLADII